MRSTKRLSNAAPVAMRMALAAGFLSAVADRFGLWGPIGTPGVSWGGFAKFLDYTATLLREPFLLIASATLLAPADLIRPMARFRRAAITSGPDRLADPARVFSHAHVAHVMRPVLDRPVAARPAQQGLGPGCLRGTLVMK